MISAVVDTNTLASGTLTAATPPGQILDAWRNKQFDLAVSDHLLAELERTLQKSYFTARMNDEARQELLKLLRERASHTPITTSVSGVATHPEDDLVLSTAVSAHADYLVTGDEALRRKVGDSYQGVKVVSPRQFVRVLEESGSI